MGRMTLKWHGGSRLGGGAYRGGSRRGGDTCVLDLGRGEGDSFGSKEKENECLC